MKTEKNIEEFTKYIMKEANVEKPSADFLNKVMDSVKMESELSLSKVYRPLISKSAWAAIAVAFVALCIFILTGASQDSLLIPTIHFAIFDKIPSINLFERIQLSETFTFSFVLFSILAILQLVVIKNYFNKHNRI
jgi:hypothetical protein